MKLSRKSARRKGLSGILSAIILFALLFTAGVSFFRAASGDQELSAQAYSQRLSLQSQATHESLTLKVGSGVEHGTDYLWVMVNNTGGIDSTISSIYVSSLSDQILTSSPSTGSPFLSTSPDLNQSLPITLDSGASTTETVGNIQINPAALSACTTITSAGCDGQTVYVSVLTKLGNVFSVSFPPTSSVTLKNILVNQNLLDEYLVSQSDSIINETELEGSCTGCVSGYYAGGNILVMLLTATPSPVEQGGTITVQATVWDYSAYAAESPTVTLGATYTGSATVTPNIGPTGSLNYVCGSFLTPIPSGGSESTTCTFAASEGNLGGGTVTFTGQATACIETGTSAKSPCSAVELGTPAASSVSSSNPVEVGVAVSFGLWQPNFYVFYYTGCSGSSCLVSPSCPLISDLCGAGVISNSETYVAVYVEVTNEGSTPLTLLDNSYIQSVSPNVEFDLFMGCSGVSAAVCNLNGYTTGVSYGATSGTFSAYGCSDSAPSPPADTVTGQSCLTVDQGQTATLMFVAAAPGTNTWSWGTTNPGGTGGENAAILLDFAACTSTPASCSGGTGTYVATTQQLPFEGVVVP